jgi:hypothetical protein
VNSDRVIDMSRSNTPRTLALYSWFSGILVLLYTGFGAMTRPGQWMTFFITSIIFGILFIFIGTAYVLSDHSEPKKSLVDGGEKKDKADDVPVEKTGDAVISK